MNMNEARRIAHDLRKADSAIQEALKTSAGDTPVKWATDIAKARALLKPIMEAAERFCGQTGDGGGSG